MGEKEDGGDGDSGGNGGGEGEGGRGGGGLQVGGGGGGSLVPVTPRIFLFDIGVR